MKVVNAKYPYSEDMRPSPLARSGTSGGATWEPTHSLAKEFSTATALIIASQFVTYPPRVVAVDLQACGARLQEQQDASWNATNNTGTPPQLSLSYEQCLAECGSGLGDVNWESFSQNFGTWLLPWIALMFQIPFGAERRFRRLTFASSGNG